MSVFMRTGRDTAVSFPWWFYLLVVLPLQLLVVLPLQLLVAFYKAMLYMLVMAGAAIVWFARTTGGRLHKENGPPAP